MNRIIKKGLACLMSSVLLVSSMAFTAGAADEAPKTTGGRYNLAVNIKDGAILHAWSWSFKTIKENLKLIADSGYSSVQTSPINKIIVGDNGGMQLYGNGKWYYQYQPVLYTIGNYQLGTKAEFEDLCKEADKYGIKIIVDAVVNHCSSDYNAIDSSIKNLEGGGFHPRVEIESWTDRYQVTQGKLSGLYDLNTQNPVVQNMIKDYLKECVAAGADGFRYDAAKHIELPDDDPSFAGDFWDKVLDNGAEFQYGEILQGGADRIADYSKYMNVTASLFGQNLRNGVTNGKLSTRLLNGYFATGVSADKMVTWVESHDNYNDGTWEQLDNQDIRQGWALISAKGDTTPLFFSRPDGSSTTNKWGKNKIGIRGDSNFFHPEVVEVNKFRNAMIGESVNAVPVTLEGKTSKDFSCVVVERGTKGAVVINYSTKDLSIDTKTNLANGTYNDAVTGKAYTVKDGKLKANIAAGAIVVLYDKPKPTAELGDVNLDNKVDITDATLVQMHAAKLYTLSDEGEAVADVNGDKKVDISDATLIQMKAAGLNVGF